MAKSWRLTRISRWNGLEGRWHILSPAAQCKHGVTHWAGMLKTAHITGRGSLGVTPRDARIPVAGSRSIFAIRAGVGNLRAAHASHGGARRAPRPGVDEGGR